MMLNVFITLSSHFHLSKHWTKKTSKQGNSRISKLITVIVLVSKRVHMWVFLSTRLLTFLAFTVITQKSNFTEQVKRKIHSKIQQHGSGVDFNSWEIFFKKVIAAKTTTWMWLKYAQIKLTRTRNIKSSYRTVCDILPWVPVMHNME